MDIFGIYIFTTLIILSLLPLRLIGYKSTIYSYTAVLLLAFLQLFILLILTFFVHIELLSLRVFGIVSLCIIPAFTEEFLKLHLFNKLKNKRQFWLIAWAFILIEFSLNFIGGAVSLQGVTGFLYQFIEMSSRENLFNLIVQRIPSVILHITTCCVFYFAHYKKITAKWVLGGNIALHTSFNYIILT